MVSDQVPGFNNIHAKLPHPLGPVTSLPHTVLDSVVVREGVIGNLSDLSQKIVVVEETVLVFGDGGHPVLNFQMGFLPSRETGLVSSAMLYMGGHRDIDGGPSWQWWEANPGGPSSCWMWWVADPRGPPCCWLWWVADPGGPPSWGRLKKFYSIFCQIIKNLVI